MVSGVVFEPPAIPMANGSWFMHRMSLGRGCWQWSTRKRKKMKQLLESFKWTASSLGQVKLYILILTPSKVKAGLLIDSIWSDSFLRLEVSCPHEELVGDGDAFRGPVQRGVPPSLDLRRFNEFKQGSCTNKILLMAENPAPPGMYGTL